MTIKGSSVQVPLVDLKAQYDSIKAEVDSSISEVIGESAFVGGRFVDRFENEFAAFHGLRHVVAVGNGTDALEIALQALGVGPGDEVVVPTMTFAATAEAVVQRGARPVFVDCLPGTLNVDPSEVEQACSGRTKAIIAVHLYGQPAEMDAVSAIAASRGISLVEDAAQAHGARWRGQRVGTHGAMCTFSFYPGKNLGAYGDGGAIGTNDPDTAQMIRRIANHGRTSKYLHEVSGRNSRLDGMQAAILSVKLARLDVWNERRRQIASEYREGLPPKVDVVAVDPRAESVYHLFVVGVAERDRVQEVLREAGISSGVHYPIPLHRQPAFRSCQASRTDRPWNADRAAQRILSLPMYPELTSDAVSYVCDVVTRAVKDL